MIGCTSMRGQWSFWMTVHGALMQGVQLARFEKWMPLQKGIVEFSASKKLQVQESHWCQFDSWCVIVKHWDLDSIPSFLWCIVLLNFKKWKSALSMWKILNWRNYGASSHCSVHMKSLIEMEKLCLCQILCPRIFRCQLRYDSISLNHSEWLTSLSAHSGNQYALARSLCTFLLFGNTDIRSDLAASAFAEFVAVNKRCLTDAH